MKKWLKKIGILLSIVVLIACGYYFIDVYVKIFMPNVKIENKKGKFFYIPTGSKYQDVVKELVAQKVIVREGSFMWVAEKMNYPNHVYAGRYYVNHKMNNKQLITLLRSGIQLPIKIMVPKKPEKKLIAEMAGDSLETTPQQVYDLLNDTAFLKKYELNPNNVLAIFLVDKYELFWNTSAVQFFEKMYKEFNKFWNPTRVAAAKKHGITPVEAVILASIVEKETYRDDEKSTIAGVYLNRLKIDMKLQADPTVIFAAQDNSIRRVTSAHLKTVSPYNTYRVKGLPPGPIWMPSKLTIDSTIYPKEHKYLYFVANPTFSGYHLFSENYGAHKSKASGYYKKMNSKGGKKSKKAPPKKRRR